MSDFIARALIFALLYANVMYFGYGQSPDWRTVLSAVCWSLGQLIYWRLKKWLTKTR